jgi:hypothetical protein
VPHAAPAAAAACRDFFKVSLARRSHKRRAAKHTVRDIMSHPVIAFDSHEPIELCAQMMQEKGVRRAAVRDVSVTSAESAAAAKAPGQHLAAYVGLVSDASIFRRLGLYSEEGTALEDEDHGLLGLPLGLRQHHGLGAESSADGSGLDTPCSTSRAGTPLTGASSLAAPDAVASGRQASALAAAGSMQQATVGSACSTPTRQQQQPQLLTLPDLVVMREGQQGTSGSSSSTGSMGSSQPTAAAAAAAVGQLAVCVEESSSGSKPVAAAAAAAAGDDIISASSSGAPDVLSRYKTAAALWEVDMSEMEVIKRIGEGSFGEVMVANYRGTKVRAGS